MATLPYAAPTTQTKAPALVRPTKRTLFLLILTTATFYWLHTRHEPWRLTSTIQTPNSPGSLVLNDDFLLWYPGNAPFQSWDSRTGKPLFKPDTTEYADGASDRLMWGGRRILRYRGAGEFSLIDPRNGSVLLSGDSKSASAGRIADLRADMKAVFLPDSSESSSTGTFYPFDPSRPILRFNIISDAFEAQFSPDGAYIIYKSLQDLPGRKGLSLKTQIADTNSGTMVFSLKNLLRPALVSADCNYFTAVVSPEDDPFNCDLVQYSIPSGKALSSTRLPQRPESLAVTPDGHYALAGWFGRTSKLSCYDLRSSQMTWQTAVSEFPQLAAFPDSTRFVAPSLDFSTFALYRVDSPRPVAILASPWVAKVSSAKIAPDGRTIAVLSSDAFFQNSTLHLYHPTGPDCPESTLGLFAFPHTWLLLALLIATTLSLRKDAARHTPPHAHLLSLAIILATLPRTFHFLTSAALSHLLLTPAPLLLVAASALRTGATFWRWTTFTLLALQLPLNLLCLHHLRKQSMQSVQPVTPIALDRIWPIPNIPLVITLALTTALILPALYHLARPAKTTNP